MLSLKTACSKSSHQIMFAPARCVPRAVATVGPAVANQTRNMATLKEISMRLKSVSNIGKITKSMKMIASTKVNKAQRTMEAARVYGQSSVALFQHAETASESTKPLVIVISSDRGLCGGIHSSVSKSAKQYIAQNPACSLGVIGIKAKAQMQRENRDRMVVTFDQVAKQLPTWGEAALIAHEIIKSGAQFDSIQLVYNKFKSVIAYEATTLTVPSYENILESPKLSAYEAENDSLKNFQEFALANSLYWAIAEGYASEMAAKRTAMENATKNAGEMIQKLTLTYNRSRQASITNDLIDIITGASAM